MVYYTVIHTFAGAHYFMLFSGLQYKELQPLVMVRILYVCRYTVRIRSCVRVVTMRELSIMYPGN